MSEPTDVFCVAFNTKEMPGLIVATQVTLSTKIMRPTDVDGVRIDLRDHPLYPALAEYVRNNPVEKRR